MLSSFFSGTVKLDLLHGWNWSMICEQLYLKQGDQVLLNLVFILETSQSLE